MVRPDHRSGVVATFPPWVALSGASSKPEKAPLVGVQMCGSRNANVREFHVVVQPKPCWSHSSADRSGQTSKSTIPLRIALSTPTINITPADNHNCPQNALWAIARSYPMESSIGHLRGRFMPSGIRDSFLIAPKGLEYSSSGWFTDSSFNPRLSAVLPRQSFHRPYRLIHILPQRAK